MRTVWVPEVMEKPGMYAHAHQERQILTALVNFALMFESEEGCARWCRLNPVAHFKPVEVPFASPKHLHK